MNKIRTLGNRADNSLDDIIKNAGNDRIIRRMVYGEEAVEREIGEEAGEREIEKQGWQIKELMEGPIKKRWRKYFIELHSISATTRKRIAVVGRETRGYAADPEFYRPVLRVYQINRKNELNALKSIKLPGRFKDEPLPFPSISYSNLGENLYLADQDHINVYCCHPGSELEYNHEIILEPEKGKPVFTGVGSDGKNIVASLYHEGSKIYNELRCFTPFYRITHLKTSLIEEPADRPTCISIKNKGRDETWIAYGTESSLGIILVKTNAGPDGNLGPEYEILNMKVHSFDHVTDIAWDPQSNAVAVAVENSVNVYSIDINRVKLLTTIPSKHEKISFTPDGNTLFTADKDYINRYYVSRHKEND